MTAGKIDLVLRILLFVGVGIYFGAIYVLLKRKKLAVKYALIWLLSGIVLLAFAFFPYIVLVLRDILKFETAANMIFTMGFAFVLLVLLNLSVAVSELSEKCKRLTQASALLEERVRQLEEQQK